jgi:tetratricopeptide (TPR) repeat protein
MRWLLPSILAFTLSPYSSYASEKVHPPHPMEEAKKEAPKEPEKPSEATSALERKSSCELLPQKTSKDLWGVAQCYQEAGDPGQSVLALRELVRKSPLELEAYFIAAWLLWDEGRKAGGNREIERTREAVEELQSARLANPTHWMVDVEMGDFFALRLKAPEKAIAEYTKARLHYDGDYARAVPAASPGRKAAIENRLARTSQALGRKGEAVEASCRAAFFDPDDDEAKRRIESLSGSCDRKKVEDPRPSARKHGAAPR